MIITLKWPESLEVLTIIRSLNCMNSVQRVNFLHQNRTVGLRSVRRASAEYSLAG